MADGFRIIARRGNVDYLIGVGKGDALGQKNVELGRVYSAGALSKEPWPVSSIVARGYWEPVSDLPEWELERVREKVAPLLAGR